MRNFKKIMCIIAFVVLFVGINACLNYLLVSNSLARVKIHNIVSEEYDDIIVGTSHGLCGIDPETLYNESGKKSINLCIAGEYMVDSYHLIKEACKNKTPEKIIYEMDPGYWCSKPNEDVDYVRIFNEMPWSVNKIEYFFDKILNADFRIGMFEWFSFRKNLMYIPARISEKNSDDYKNYRASYFDSDGQKCYQNGFMYIGWYDDPNKSKDNLILWDEDKLNYDVKKYFEKTVELCREKGIELVVVTTPVPEVTLKEYEEEFAKANKYFTEYFEDLGVDYYNFNYLDLNSLDLSLDSFTDYEGHMFGDRAIEFSSIMAKYIY